MSEPLWDADRFIDRLSLYTFRYDPIEDNDYVTVGVAVFVAMQMRADYEAKIAELEAAQQWTPVPDGYRWVQKQEDGTRLQIDWWKEHLIVGINGQATGVIPPDDIRLCQGAAPAAQPEDGGAS